MIVFLGAYNIDERIEMGIERRHVDDTRLHPYWESSSEKYDADLAILVLSQTVEFTKNIRPVCMPENDPPVDVLGSIVGNSFIFSSIEIITKLLFVRMGFVGENYAI